MERDTEENAGGGAFSKDFSDAVDFAICHICYICGRLMRLQSVSGCFHWRETGTKRHNLMWCSEVQWGVEKKQKQQFQAVGGKVMLGSPYTMPRTFKRR